MKSIGTPAMAGGSGNAGTAAMANVVATLAANPNAMGMRGAGPGRLKNGMGFSIGAGRDGLYAGAPVGPRWAVAGVCRRALYGDADCNRLNLLACGWIGAAFRHATLPRFARATPGWTVLSFPGQMAGLILALCTLLNAKQAARRPTTGSPSDRHTSDPEISLRRANGHSLTRRSPRHGAATTAQPT